ncbi:replication protein A2, 32kDa [Guillardia theta CCMP2712]|uniref:Replication protein A2, 32kDa n=2 Tax=Guillardia theta TaxID=55529 RepID=L1IVT0_GUITC|nr:replication protein A2, 32kDa [Guillardia theta CCMP2712]EKX39999.1 replication protein A2, 32kDa [Guillardia theta CCMP2712]|eukprot:XP_005826979.1 replication protein A2, 32kDa [Guillardia theta CCMP2712]
MDYGDIGSYGGGGFIASQSGGGGGGSGKKSNAEKGMLPVSIKQVMNAPQDSQDEDIKIDGRDTKQVTIIAYIVDVKETSTSVTFSLEDGTGNIDAIMWIDQDESEFMVRSRAEWVVGTYVRVVGQVRSHNGKRSMVAFHLRTVTDFNELTYHLFDTIHAHLYNTRGPLADSKPQTGFPSSSFQSPGKPSMGPGFTSPSQPGGAGAGRVDSSRPAGGPVTDMREAVHKAFIDFGATGDLTGLSIDNCVQQVSRVMGRSVSRAEVSSHIENLALDGHIYSTIDEEHFYPS